jgi:DNA-directed RNA polymerase specialized sigma24 family protein
MDRVDQVLHALSDRQFDTVIYRYLMGHPTELTAKLMHVAPGTVKATLHQASNRVRAQIPTELVDEWIDAAG